MTIDDEEKSPIGQYTFTYNGGTYTLRAAKDTGDISGVWENGTTLGNGREGDVTAITTENGGLWSRWFDGDMQYSLYAEGAAMDDYCRRAQRHGVTIIIINGPLRGDFSLCGGPFVLFCC